MGNTFEMDDASGSSSYVATVRAKLRVMIGDTDSSDYTYTNDQLEGIIYVASCYVNTELCLSYTVDVVAETISPNPVSESDEQFINFVSLKAACTLLRGEQKLAANCSVTVTDGPSTVRVGNMSKDLAAMAETFCNEYESMKFKYLMTGGCDSNAPRRAVITPTFSSWFERND